MTTSARLGFRHARCAEGRDRRSRGDDARAPNDALASCVDVDGGVVSTSIGSRKKKSLIQLSTNQQSASFFALAQAGSLHFCLFFGVGGCVLELVFGRRAGLRRENADLLVAEVPARGRCLPRRPPPRPSPRLRPSPPKTRRLRGTWTRPRRRSRRSASPVSRAPIPHFFFSPWICCECCSIACTPVQSPSPFLPEVDRNPPVDP